MKAWGSRQGLSSMRDIRRGLLRSATWLTLIPIVRPVLATPSAMRDEIQRFTGGAPTASAGIRLDIPEIVENGNSVPVTVHVDSPMSEREHVRRIALFSEKNPAPGVLLAHLSPANGRAQIAFRMRMAESQRLVAVAEMSDRSYRLQSIEVVVALAACLE